MAGPIYPDVPNAPGVPPVQRDDSNSGGTIQPRLTSDSQAISNRTAGQWGIYTTSGGQVLEWDNVISVEGAEEFRNSDYPVEKGGFATYNKVTVPFETRVIMTKGGPLSERQAFMKTLDKLKLSIDLYNVVTPEKTYLNANITHVGLMRSATAGATLVAPEVHLQEIRQSASAQFSNSKEAASADATNTGTVQAARPTPAQDAIVASAIQ